MVKLVALPGVLLTILGFVFGFFINDVAIEGAYNRAYEGASQLILNLTKEASDAVGHSRRIAKETNELKSDIERTLGKANAMIKRFETAEAIQQSEKSVGKVVETLLARDDFKKIVLEASSGINLFSVDKYRILWTSENGRGGPHEIDMSGYVPPQAEGVILRVNIFTDQDSNPKTFNESGSFVCSDANGDFTPNASPFFHYQQNGFTNYASKWIGGTVFCPLTHDRSIIWKMMSNANKTKPSNAVISYGTLIGWYN